LYQPVEEKQSVLACWSKLIGLFQTLFHGPDGDIPDALVQL